MEFAKIPIDNSKSLLEKLNEYKKVFVKYQTSILENKKIADDINNENLCNTDKIEKEHQFCISFDISPQFEFLAKQAKLMKLKSLKNFFNENSYRYNEKILKENNNWQRRINKSGFSTNLDNILKIIEFQVASDFLLFLTNYYSDLTKIFKSNFQKLSTELIKEREIKTGIFKTSKKTFFILNEMYLINVIFVEIIIDFMIIKLKINKNHLGEIIEFS
jgi:hypothetical protein